MERGSSAGLFGHDTGTVGLPAGMAAFRCAHAAGASCICVVKREKSLRETQNKPQCQRLLPNICILTY